MSKRFALVIAAVLGLLLGSGTAAMATTPAGVVPATACHTYTITSQAGTYTSGGDVIGYTAQHSFVRGSCIDINVSDVYVVDGVNGVVGTEMRVRFYPSSGGSYVNGWTIMQLASPTWQVVASDVLNGTKYRLEWLTDVGDTPNANVKD